MKARVDLPAFTPLERLTVPRPVDRIAAMISCCKGKVVLDLGALDETAYNVKHGEGTWLHEAISRVAKRVVGIDNSALVPAGGLLTADNAMIHRVGIDELDVWLSEKNLTPDVIVAGELIEHLPNPLGFLVSLKLVDRLAGKTLILSTPNATAIHNCIIALFSRESTHRDHLSILSYKTLTTLCSRASFAQWEITPYYARFTEMKARHRGVARMLVGLAERVINCVEWIFPLMAFGYVVQIEI